MGLTITNPEAVRLAEEMAHEMGVPVEEVVLRALQEMHRRLRVDSGGQAAERRSGWRLSPETSVELAPRSADKEAAMRPRAASLPPLSPEQLVRMEKVNRVLDDLRADLGTGGDSRTLVADLYDEDTGLPR